MDAAGVYDRLRGRIVSGDLMPNQHLVETDLAASLGVGRSAVRDAPTRLEQDGLATGSPTGAPRCG